MVKTAYALSNIAVSVKMTLAQNISAFEEKNKTSK